MGRRRGAAISCDVGPGAKARINQAERGEPFQGGPVLGEMLRLDTDLAVPVQAQPGHILQDGSRVDGAATGRVDVLDAQQETAAGFAGAPPGHQRRKAWPRCRNPVGLGAKRVSMDCDER